MIHNKPLQEEGTKCASIRDGWAGWSGIFVAALLFLLTAAPQAAFAVDTWVPLPNITGLQAGSVIALQADTGKYLVRCTGCVKGAPGIVQDAAFVNGTDINDPKAHFTVKILNGKYTLQSAPDHYLTRCYGCFPGAPPWAQDTSTMHVNDQIMGKHAEWTITKLATGKYALKTDSDYLTRCCRPTPTAPNVYPLLEDVATMHAPNPNSDSAQWAILVKQPSVDPFNMIIASDPQWAWTAKTDTPIPGAPQSDADKELEATTLNENHVKSMNQLIASPGNVKGVIINGDLTAFGQKNEFEKFVEIYSKLAAPTYPGLGNHDYLNNVDQCWVNNCAGRMVLYMVEHIKTNGFTNYDFALTKDTTLSPNDTTVITGSLAYSWDIGNVHFVQLHNFPIYHKRWQGVEDQTSSYFGHTKVNITSSLAWLKTDLANARRDGKIIILNYHDSDNNWDHNYSPLELSTLSTEFQNMLSTYNVGAVFVGHYHMRQGLKTLTRPAFKLRPGFDLMYGSTPVFYSGSASQSTYLLVNFKGNQMTVENVSSLNGVATRNPNSKTTKTLFDKKG